MNGNNLSFRFEWFMMFLVSQFIFPFIAAYIMYIIGVIFPFINNLVNAYMEFLYGVIFSTCYFVIYLLCYYIVKKLKKINVSEEIVLSLILVAFMWFIVDICHKPSGMGFILDDWNFGHLIFVFYLIATIEFALFIMFSRMLSRTLFSPRGYIKKHK